MVGIGEFALKDGKEDRAGIGLERIDLGWNYYVEKGTAGLNSYIKCLLLGTISKALKSPSACPV